MHAACQVSCNDWCLRRELASAYLLERLVDACERAHVGHGHPDDQADMWTESSYFPVLPSRLGDKQPSYIAPWMSPLDVCPFCRILGGRSMHASPWQPCTHGLLCSAAAVQLPACFWVCLQTSIPAACH